jgi:hypothetical protein
VDTISKYLELFHLPFFNSAASKANTPATAAKVLNTTKSIADTASKSLSSLHAPSLSSGELFGILIIVGVLLLALTLGRTRTLISTLALYVAFTLQTMFPFFGWLLKHQSFTDDLPTLRVFVFIILYAISFGLMNRSVLKARFNLGESSFLSVILMGLAQLVLIISIILNLAPSFFSISSRLPEAVLPYIGTQTALFCWALVPIALLLFQRQSD